MNVQQVGIIGCGLMGSGIAEQSIRCGFDVVVRELNNELLQKGEARIMRSMQRALKRGKITQDAFDFYSCQFINAAMNVFVGTHSDDVNDAIDIYQFDQINCKMYKY